MRNLRVLSVLGMAALVAVILVTPSVAAPPVALLKGRAVLPAATFAPGPPSGAFIGAGPINGVTRAVRRASRCRASRRSCRPRSPAASWVMEDNGYGAKANSADFLLRVYRVRPHSRRPGRHRHGRRRRVHPAPRSRPQGSVPDLNANATGC